MLAAAAVFIYVEEPLTVRIICAAAFLICAVLLYFTISADKEGEGSAEQAPQEHGKRHEKKEADATLPLNFDGASKEAGAPESTGQPGPGSEAPPPLLPYQRKEVRIPPEYFRGGDTDVPADDPRGEFDFLVRKLLIVLKELLVAHGIALFWINRDRRQIVVGEHVSDSRHFTTTRRMPLGEDLVSRIGISGEPEIVSDIPVNSESDLLPYYDSRQSIRSFVGVPVYFASEPIAVLAADSKAPDSFGVETVATVGHFTALIATLLRSYNQKFDLDADARLLATLDRMRKSIPPQADTSSIVAAGATAVSESIDWDYIALITYDQKKQGWTVGKSMSKSAAPYIPEGAVIEPDKGAIGKSLFNARPLIQNAPVFPEYRFSHSEKIDGAGHLCIAPIATANRSFGLIVAEYKEKPHYGERDLDILQRLAQYIALFMELSSLGELARTQLLIDETTRAGSRTFLLKRLQEEYARSQSHGGEVAFYLVAIDRPEAILEKYDRGGMDSALSSIARTLQGAVKPYDVVSRFDHYRFGVLALHTGAEDAFLQGEKLRKVVAGSVIPAGPMTFSVTVSVAGCVLSAGIEPVQALKALQMAQEKANAEGGNVVKIV